MTYLFPHETDHETSSFLSSFVFFPSSLSVNYVITYVRIFFLEVFVPFLHPITCCFSVIFLTENNERLCVVCNAISCDSRKQEKRTRMKIMLKSGRCGAEMGFLLKIENIKKHEAKRRK